MTGPGLCSRCGEAILAGDRFCAGCGWTVPGAERAPDGETAALVDGERTGPHNPFRTWQVVLAAIFLAAVLMVCVAWLVGMVGTISRL